MIDLDAIRARDRDYDDVFEAQANMSKDIAHRLAAWPVADRRALLAYVDALVAAAGKAVEELTDACDDSDGIPYGTLGTQADQPDAAVIAETIVKHLADNPLPPPPVIKGPGRVTVEEAMQPFGKTDQRRLPCAGGKAMIGLAAIRARDDASVIYPETLTVVHDRRALLAAYDALRAAAGKVTCETCRGTGIERTLVTACPDCTDLRTLLGEKP